MLGLGKKIWENITLPHPHLFLPPSKSERKQEIWKSESKSRFIFWTTKIIFIMERSLPVVLWTQNSLLIQLSWGSNSETSHCWMIFILNAYYAVWNLKDPNHIFAAKSCWITNVVYKVFVLINLLQKYKNIHQTVIKCNLLHSRQFCHTELPGM